ncbi:uncharacterized protein LOC110268440 [Arachis ipaensis]|uniref:uncharacterized protein LOC110268440 n=1 Tax=Arachis ipaensis TaxID=130454 RepID=UPI000A2B8876|nr:uncharacterized protein LOC110268440 [Arachis ipaensis]
MRMVSSMLLLRLKVYATILIGGPTHVYKLIEVLWDLDAEHSVVYATPYPPFFDDVIGKEVVFKVDRKKVGNRPNVGTFKVVNCSDDHVIVNKFKTDPVSSRLLPPTVFSPIYEDVIQNPQPHDEISSLGSRISVTSDNMESIEVDMEALGAAYNLTKPNEEFHLDASDFLYKLIGKKLVFMVDPQPVESDIICPAYNVFKVSTHEFMLKLIERLENRALNACAIVSASNVASIKNPVSHISGSVLPAHKSIRVVNEIVCNKRLASPYRDVPRSTKQKLEDVFSRSIDETWNDNEEASSSMNI